MIFHRSKSNYGNTTYIVELADNELELSDATLITMADNRVTEYSVENVGEAYHFGGRVTKRPGKIRTSTIFAEIVVYID